MAIWDAAYIFAKSNFQGLYMLMGVDLQKFYNELGARIKEARINASFNQDALAEFLNLTRTSIVNIESGKQRPSIHSIMLIAKFLNADFRDLIPNLVPDSETTDVRLTFKKKDIQTDTKFDNPSRFIEEFLTSIKK